MSDVTRFSSETLRELRCAGWYPGRIARSEVTAWREQLRRQGLSRWFPTAESALLEFGALEIGEGGEGEECARVAVAIEASEGFSHPRLLERFYALELAVGEWLCPLGHVDHGHAGLYIAESGRVFMVMDPHIWRVGDCFDDALERILRGRKELDHLSFQPPRRRVRE
jgi:hypothetical protein